MWYIFSRLCAFPWYRITCLSNVISLERTQHNSKAVRPTHIEFIFPLGTHHCRVDSVEQGVCQTLLHVTSSIILILVGVLIWSPLSYPQALSPCVKENEKGASCSLSSIFVFILNCAWDLHLNDVISGHPQRITVFPRMSAQVLINFKVLCAPALIRASFFRVNIWKTVTLSRHSFETRRSFKSRQSNGEIGYALRELWSQSKAFLCRN